MRLNFISNQKYEICHLCIHSELWSWAGGCSSSAAGRYQNQGVHTAVRVLLSHTHLLKWGSPRWQDSAPSQKARRWATWVGPLGVCTAGCKPASGCLAGQACLSKACCETLRRMNYIWLGSISSAPDSLLLNEVFFSPGPQSQTLARIQLSLVIKF